MLATPTTRIFLLLDRPRLLLIPRSRYLQRPQLCTTESQQLHQTRKRAIPSPAAMKMPSSSTPLTHGRPYELCLSCRTPLLRSPPLLCIRGLARSLAHSVRCLSARDLTAAATVAVLSLLLLLLRLRGCSKDFSFVGIYFLL